MLAMAMVLAAIWLVFEVTCPCSPAMLVSAVLVRPCNPEMAAVLAWVVADRFEIWLLTTTRFCVFPTVAAVRFPTSCCKPCTVEMVEPCASSRDEMRPSAMPMRALVAPIAELLAWMFAAFCATLDCSPEIAAVLLAMAPVLVPT